MAIRNFDVGPRKSLVRAIYTDLPDLAFITGANGAGKSSFLMLLKESNSQEGDTKVMHIGPHHPWRKQKMEKASTFGLTMSFNDLLATPSFPQLDQLYFRDIFRFSGQARDPDASDESQSLVKHAIARVNEKYRDRLQDIHERHSRIDKDEIPDPFAPINDLLKRLLPHLVFLRVDESNKKDVRVLFGSHYSASDVEFDIDFLSSGEKAILTLFLPVLEYQIDKRLGILHDGETRTFIIDEPELHLHPGLQADVVAYLRHLTVTEGIQFIVATHSPTIIEAALPDELFLLTPWQASLDGNQFSRLADTQERLIVIKELLGTAFSYSRTRPVLFIEGEFPADTSKQTDLGLLELMLPDLRGYVFVPSQGKTQAISSASRLRRAATEQEHAITAFALVDADYDADAADWIFPWPVCMVENLLLEPKAIAAIMTPYAQHGALAHKHEVELALQDILRASANDEAKRRLKRSLGVLTVRPDLEFDGDVPRIVLAQDLSGLEATASEDLQGRWKAVLENVNRELTDGTASLRFHGKTILSKYFRAQIQNYIPKYQNFVFQLAREIGVSGLAEARVGSTIRMINRYFPRDLIDLLSDMEGLESARHSGVDVERLKAWAEERFAYFEGRLPSPADTDLSQEKALVALMNHLKTSGETASYTRLRPLVVDIIAR